MEGYKDIPVEERRRQFNLILKQTLVAHPEVSAVYTSWAPNALDGMDAEYADTPGTDASGRYMTSWTYKPTGPIMEAIQSFGFDEIMQATSGEEFIVEPSMLPIGGKDTLATTICIPIKDSVQDDRSCRHNCRTVTITNHCKLDSKLWRRSPPSIKVLRIILKADCPQKILFTSHSPFFIASGSQVPVPSLPETSKQAHPSTAETGQEDNPGQGTALPA
jgi:hypothetical protein